MTSHDVASQVFRRTSALATAASVILLSGVVYWRASQVNDEVIYPMFPQGRQKCNYPLRRARLLYCCSLCRLFTGQWKIAWRGSDLLMHSAVDVSSFSLCFHLSPLHLAVNLSRSPHSHLSSHNSCRPLLFPLLAHYVCRWERKKTPVLQKSVLGIIQKSIIQRYFHKSFTPSHYVILVMVSFGNPSSS